ncbi:hypothetical protein EDF70_102468 [Neorhizobium sp. JUb45]|nr:hypothetical protein EDF70_102468 [Neorhizobium sp. JUb45]
MIGEGRFGQHASLSDLGVDLQDIAIWIAEEDGPMPKSVVCQRRYQADAFGFELRGTRGHYVGRYAKG